MMATDPGAHLSHTGIVPCSKCPSLHFYSSKAVVLSWKNWFSEGMEHIKIRYGTLSRFRFEDPLYADPSGLFNPAGAFSPSHGWIVTFRWDKCGYGVCGVMKTDSKVGTL
jgi:hypothetical protein